MVHAGTDVVIDLGEVARVCHAITGWYDALCAGREPSLRALDDALVELRAVPPLGGRLGRAIRVIAGGGAADRDATVAALETLRSLAPIVCGIAATRATPRPRPRRRYDTPLPGLGTRPAP